MMRGMPSDAPQVEGLPGAGTVYRLTALTARSKKTTKQYKLDEAGKLQVVPYDMEALFTNESHPVGHLDDLAARLDSLSQQDNVMLIRGQPTPRIAGSLSRRYMEYFPEPREGCPFVMLDFDDLPLPEGIDPLGQAAIEYAIGKLPEVFRQASYYYQFSSSAGICREDGTPLKSGLNVHLFYWLSRPVPGIDLANWLQGHCLEAGFYQRLQRSDGTPIIKYGIDFSVIRNAVQPHYIAAPLIAPEVTCRLPPQRRQGLVKKAHDHVTLPEFDPVTLRKVIYQHKQLSDAYKRECGFKKVRSLTRKPGQGVSVNHYFEPAHPAELRLGREFVDAKLKDVGTTEAGMTRQVAQLFFRDESSPGSWYVDTSTPTVARRYGDHAQVHLREISQGAYEYVRDQLGWFSELNQCRHQLTEEGYLPELASFLTTRDSVLIAPTGSGKTTAFCRYVARRRGRYIVYTAQTIALTRQMESDLQEAGLAVVHYQDVPSPDFVGEPAVYVNTNESLPKIFQGLVNQGRDFDLVVDEVHVALDDFMRTEKKSRSFEAVLTRAATTLFMTATITPLQTKKLLELLSRTRGELTADRFAYHDFSPVREYPLFWAPANQFNAHVVALFRHYGQLKREGRPIPRTILLLDTSKMKLYASLLEAYGLSDEAHVVSRVEATQREIEEARVSDKPLLVSSPLFALGLNFEHPPERLWTTFRHLSVDTSQIIQTLNRANRTPLACEVRIYVGSMDDTPIVIPAADAVGAEIEDYYRGETTLEGILDQHFQIARMTYLQLRKYEKDTGKSMYALHQDDAFQNYRIVTEWPEFLTINRDDADTFRQHRENAREAYEEAILVEARPLMGERIEALKGRYDRIEQDERQYYQAATVPPRMNMDKKLGILLALIQSETAKHAEEVNARRCFTLLGLRPPFVSEQYQQSSAITAQAVMEKLEHLQAIPPLLRRLRSGELDGVRFAKKIRLAGHRAGILALATSNREFIELNKMLGRLDRLHGQLENSSETGRRRFELEMFDLVKEFLATLGIQFRLSRERNGRFRVDPNAPIVPDWDFERILQRIAVMRLNTRHGPEWGGQEDQNVYDYHSGVSFRLCRRCMHCDSSFECAWGISTDAPWLDWYPGEEDCGKFRAMNESLHWPIDLPEESRLAA